MKLTDNPEFMQTLIAKINWMQEQCQDEYRNIVCHRQKDRDAQWSNLVSQAVEAHSTVFIEDALYEGDRTNEGS